MLLLNRQGGVHWCRRIAIHDHRAHLRIRYQFSIYVGGAFHPAHLAAELEDLDLEPNLGSFACELMPPQPCLFWSKGYVDANAGFAYQFPRGVEIYGHLNNFLNEKYEEAFGYPALHLNFVSGIRFNFPAERPGASY